MSVKDKAGAAQEKAKATANRAKTRVSETAGNVRDGANRAYEGARTKAIRAYDKSREGARTGARKTGEGIDNNPLLALGGGLALGLIIGALIPRSQREKDLLRDVGSNLNGRAHNAFDAAREAGSRQLEERGLTAAAAENAVRDIARGVGEAARTSADAGVRAARD